ncbi:unnamed protein product, partial [Effrenium voratum]
ARGEGAVRDPQASKAEGRERRAPGAEATQLTPRHLGGEVGRLRALLRSCHHRGSGHLLALCAVHEGSRRAAELFGSGGVSAEQVSASRGHLQRLVGVGLWALQ